jgi:hypothetical protein
MAKIDEVEIITITDTGDVLSNAIMTVTFANTSLVAMSPAQKSCFRWTSE